MVNGYQADRNTLASCWDSFINKPIHSDVNRMCDVWGNLDFPLVSRERSLRLGVESPRTVPGAWPLAGDLSGPPWPPPPLAAHTFSSDVDAHPQRETRFAKYNLG